MLSIGIRPSVVYIRMLADITQGFREVTLVAREEITFNFAISTRRGRAMPRSLTGDADLISGKNYLDEGRGIRVRVSNL